VCVCVCVCVCVAGFENNPKLIRRQDNYKHKGSVWNFSLRSTKIGKSKFQ